MKIARKTLWQTAIHRSFFWLALLTFVGFETGGAQASGEMDDFGSEFTQVEETHDGTPKSSRRTSKPKNTTTKMKKAAVGNFALQQRRLQHEQGEKSEKPPVRNQKLHRTGSQRNYR